MLSIANVKSGMSASYYEKDDYYSKEDLEKDSKAYSKWEGSLAKELKFKGEVKSHDFQNFLNGKVTKCHTSKIIAELGKIGSDGKKQHACGIDLTFSAPKSVSILAEIGGDEKILEAHTKAVSQTLKYIEANLINTRVRVGGSSNENTNILYKTTEKVIIATFKHNTSRNLDPQLHTHCILLNITKTEDGKWRSADFKEVFKSKILLGKIYRNELAKNLREIGYETIKINKDGRFELKEIPDLVRREFSTRRIQIEEALSKSEISDAKLSERINLITRKTKQIVNREDIKQNWHQRIKKYDINLDYIIQKSRLKSIGFNKSNSSEIKQITKEAVDYAILHLSEKESVFARNKLISEALSFNDKVCVTSILYDINSRAKSNQLIIQDGKIIPSGTLLQEKENLQLLQKSKNTFDFIIDKNDLKVLDSTLLNQGQKDSVSLILHSKDGVIGIQGSAGTGKTFMLNEVRKLALQKNYEIIGLAPSTSATLTLKNDANLTKSSTLQKFIKQYEGLAYNRETKKGLYKMRDEFKNKIIIVDESSMISTKQMNSILKIANKLETKLVLVGDIRQLASVEAGKPFADLQKYGMQTAIMSEIIRQKDINLKQAVQSIIKSSVINAFKNLGNNIIEKGESEKISSKVVTEYFKLSKQDRNNTLLLSPANDTRKEINELIRSILKTKGELSNNQYTIHNILESKNLSFAQRGQSINYHKGDVIIFNKGYKVKNINKDDTFEVIDIKNDSIVLQKDNKLTEFSLNHKSLEFEIFTKKTKEISVGDKIRYLRNDKQNGIVNAHIAEVQSINQSKDEITLNEVNGKESKIRTLPLSSPSLQHIDYAYASTVFASQGKTTGKVIAVLESNKPLTNQQTFYVEISRAKEQAILIVDNKKEVQKTLQNNLGVNISALDIVVDKAKQLNRDER